MVHDLDNVGSQDFGNLHVVLWLSGLWVTLRQGGSSKTREWWWLGYDQKLPVPLEKSFEWVYLIWANVGKTMPQTTHDWEWFIQVAPIKMVITGGWFITTKWPFFSKGENPWNPAGTASAVVSLQHRGRSCVWLGG